MGIPSLATQNNKQTVEPETTEYLDRPSTHYPLISDVFVSTEYFFLHFKND